MNFDGAATLEQLWNSPDLAMWAMIAGGIALILLIVLMRADRTLANVMLALIAFTCAGYAVLIAAGGGPTPRASSQAGVAGLPALACIDDLAGETVLSACEKVLFGSPDAVAAAVNYASGQIAKLSTYGDLSTANKSMTADLMSLRRAVESDRYGLVAHVLQERHRCTPTDCMLYRSLGNRRQIVSNMEGNVYDAMISKYAATWGQPPVAAAAVPPPVASLATPAPPAGKPVNIDFPSSASTPAVSIMNPEPITGATSRSGPPANANAAAPAAQAAKDAPAPAPKKQAAKRAAPPPPPPPPVAAAPQSIVPPSSGEPKQE